MRRSLVALWVGLAGASCQDSTSKEFYPTPAIGRGLMRAIEEGKKDEEPEPEPTPEELALQAREELREAGGDDKAIHGRMQENFVRADQLQKAVIAGNLEAAHEAGQWLATHSQTEGFPDAWVAHVTALRRAAQAVVDARDIEGAARATAYVAGACGGCHLTQLGGNEMGAEPIPQHGSGIALIMRRHQWAVDRMWDSVISGKESTWRQAVDVLESSRLTPDAFLPEKARNPELKRLTRQLAGVIERATKANTPEARVKVLGEFLGTCSGCHALFEEGPEAW